MRWGRPLAAAALFAGVLALYAPSARLGFIYDDQELIVDASAPQAVGELARVFAERHWPTLPYYRPIPRASMLAQKAWHGDAPGPYHLLNAGLAAALALAALALLARPCFGLPWPLAWLGAALFAAHPVVSSCVYPIASGRETLWPTLFEVVAVWAWLGSGVRAYGVALLATGAALLSKEHAVVLPALFLLADALRLSAARLRVARHAPVWGLVAVYFAIRAAIFGGGGGSGLALAGDPAAPVWSLLYAVQTVFVPFRELVYEPVLDVWLSSGRALAAGALAVAAFAVPLARGGEWRRRVLFWAGWIVLGLLPTANLLVQDARFDERYVAFAGLGFVALGLSATAPLWGKPLAAALAALICAAAAVSAGRARFFASDAAFLAQWIATDPQQAQPRLSLAKLALRRGEPGKALAYAEQAVERAPASADAENTKGLALDALQLSDQAEASYRRAIELAPGMPLARTNLGALLLARGDLAAAAQELELALEADPRSASARINLAIARAQSGDAKAAIAELERVLADHPRNAAACFNLGVVLEQAGDVARARDAYLCALDSRPDYALARERLAKLPTAP